MPNQIRLNRLDADDMGIRTKIEDLGSERMRDGRDGGFRLFAQVEA
jgi:hypothetical protein